VPDVVYTLHMKTRSCTHFSESETTSGWNWKVA